MVAEQQSEPIATVAAPRWTRRLALGAVIAIVLVLLFGLAVRLFALPVPLHVVLGLFLLAFGCQKFAVGTDAWLRLRAPRSDGVDPREVHGTGRLAAGWIAYKYVAAAVAIAVAIYVLTIGAARVDRIWG